MSTLIVASCMPVFGCEWEQNPTSGFSGSATSIVLEDTLSELKAFFRPDLEFKDVLLSLNNALDMVRERHSSDHLDDEQRRALKTILQGRKEYIVNLPAYVKAKAREHDFTTLQLDQLHLKILDIDCANHERVLEECDTEMRWLAEKELDAAKNVRGEFLSQMVKKHGSDFLAK